VKITEQTPDVLVVRQSPWGIRAFGGFFAVLGVAGIELVTHVHRAALAGSSDAGMVVGAVFVAFGLLVIAVAPNQRVVFDRAAGVVRVIARKTTEYRLSDVSGVALEAIPGANGGLYYRPVLILSDSRHVPWTSVSTTDGRSMAVCVYAAQAFGGWRNLPDRVTSPPPAAPPVQATSRGNLMLARMLLGVFALIGVAMGGVQAFRLMTWQPVPATVMMSSVESVRGNRGTVSYRPAVSYWYRVNGTQYVAAGVTPIGISSGWRWAQSISQRFAPGAAVTAYVDPHDPGRAYLVREFSPLPLFILALVGGIWALIEWGARRSGQPVVVASGLGVPVVSPSGAALR
jgi:hypothetical protein